MRAKYAQYGSVTISAAEAIPTVFSPHRPRGQALIDLIPGKQTVLIGVSDLPHIHALPLPRTCHLHSRRRLARSATVRRTVFLLLLFFFPPSLFVAHSRTASPTASRAHLTIRGHFYSLTPARTSVLLHRQQRTIHSAHAHTRP